MPLTLTITSYQRHVPDQESVKILGRGWLSIGRTPGNDWVLPDPDQVLSKRHCTIEGRADGGYYLTDTSTNGVFLNQKNQRIGRGQTVRLNDGDRFSLGKYEIQVAISEAALPATSSPDITPAAIAALPPSNSFSIDALIGGSTAEPAPLPAATPPSLSTDSFSIDDFIGGGTSGVATPPVLSSGDLLADLQPPPLPPAAPLTVPDHVPPERQFLASPQLVPPLQPLPPPPPTTPQPAAGAVLPTCWDLPVTDAAVPPRIVDETQPIDLPAKPTTASPVPPLTPTPAAVLAPLPTAPWSSLPTEPPPAATQPVAPLASDAAVLLQAFLRGAGLPPNLPLNATDLPQLLHDIGTIFRQTVQGLMDILIGRSRIKRELGIRDITMIRPIANNPLKFSPNVEEAMLTLLTKRGPAYLDPVAALAEAFKDIEAHELAMMAGIQASLQQLLQCFDPEALAAAAHTDSVLDNLLPASRKARYWQQFRQVYGQLRQQTENDWLERFSKVFAQVYQTQQDQLNRNKP